MSAQRCPRCNRTLPRDAFYPSYRGQAGTPCRECAQAPRAQRNVAAARKAAAANQANLTDPTWQRPPALSIPAPPTRPDGSLDVVALCREWDAIVNAGAGDPR